MSRRAPYRTLFLEPVPSPDSARLRYEGKLPRVVGWVFVGCATFAWTLLLTGVGKVPEGAAGYLLAAGTTILALLLFWLRSGVEIDSGRRTFTRWWGFRLPGIPSPLCWTTKHLILDGHDKVVIETRLSHSSNSGTTTLYIVSFEGPSRVEITGSSDYPLERRFAEQIASALNLSLADESSGEEIIRHPERLDETLRERVRSKGRVTRRLDHPPRRLIGRHSVQGGTLSVDLPRRGYQGKGKVTVLFVGSVSVMLGLLLIFQRAMFADSELGDAAVFLPIGVFGLVVYSLAIWIHASTFWHVEAGPGGLRVDTRGPFVRHTVSIPADRLEEIIIESPNRPRLSGAGEAIVTRSDEATVRFGDRLSAEEKRWLVDAVERFVGG